MLQTTTLNFNSPTNHGLPSALGLGGLHPSNAANINGRIVSRSPTAAQAQEQRNLSPNKINATKKPMIVNNNMNAQNMVTNFVNKNRAGISPRNKPDTNYFTQPAQTNFTIGNFNSRGQQPLLNSKTYGARGETHFYAPPVANKSGFCLNHPSKPAEFTAELDGEIVGYCSRCALTTVNGGYNANVGPRKPHKPTNVFEEHRLEPLQFPNHFLNRHGFADIEKFVY